MYMFIYTCLVTDLYSCTYITSQVKLFGLLHAWEIGLVKDSWLLLYTLIRPVHPFSMHINHYLSNASKQLQISARNIERLAPDSVG